MDNGTEMTSNTFANWCRFSAADISFIDPGSPWQNAYVESFNGKLRDELLGIEIFTTLLQAKNHGRGLAPGLQFDSTLLITGIPDTTRIQEKLAPQQPRANNRSGTLIGGRSTCQPNSGQSQGISASIGSNGDAHDNARAESTIGSFKTEAVGKNNPFHPGPFKSIADIEYATMGWVDWYNNRRIHFTLSSIPPAEFEFNYSATHLSSQPEMSHT